MSDITTLDDLLLAHASGALAAPVSLAVATHLALSAENRPAYRRYEALGGVMLEEIDPAPVAEGALERLLGRLDEEVRESDAPPPRDACVPQPLAPYLPAPLDQLPWRSLGNAADYEIDTGVSMYRTALIKVRAGRAVPRHTHEGSEITVVLQGAFSDGRGRWRRGDLAIADSSVDHQPVADPGEDCICLAVTDARLRLTGRFLRYLNPLLRA